MTPERQAMLREVRRYEVLFEDGRIGSSTGSFILSTAFLRLQDGSKRDPTEVALYTDDIMAHTRFMFPHPILRRLQQADGVLENRFTKWQIGNNPDKNSTLFLTERRKAPDLHLKIFDQEIRRREESNYLEVAIDTKMAW